MKPTKCDKCKKFYDADKYDGCPHCLNNTAKPGFSIKRDVSVDEENNISNERRESKSKKFFSKFGVEKPESTESSTQSLIESEDFKNPTNVTERLPQNVELEENNSSEEQFKERTDYDDTSYNRSSAFDNTIVEKESVAISISEAVKNASAAQNFSDQKTVAFYDFSNDVEPVVGWLVCIKGEYLGESFNLKSGRNNIGRALTMDVALAREKTVSRERHASITFEPHQKKFFVQCGDGNGLTYVNDELLMTFKELCPYDVISIGMCKLMFLPLCGENFAWEVYLQ